ncbi:uncharacterized protein LOC130671676 [Microplitis mediator]|uniref:uncharacterized protein LOC130671676 n=1 Tax=Microplitis mediator TaxID=375433 RepID=UPI0025546007|nr:uncharacterized protein LOC130671676 [Microplitis mediator]
MSGSLQRHLRELTYPDDSEMGLFFALAIPLDDPVSTKAMSVAFFFEANYGLVKAQESLASETRKQRTVSSDHQSLTRLTVYSILESKFQSLGLPGRACLLRSICETSKLSLHRHNGLIGDLLRILLTPSSSANENLPTEYVQAEQRQAARINHHSNSDTDNNDDDDLDGNDLHPDDDNKEPNDCSTIYPLCPITIYDFITVQ